MFLKLVLGQTYVWIQIVEWLWVTHYICDEEANGEAAKCIKEDHMIGYEMKIIIKMLVMCKTQTDEFPFADHGKGNQKDKLQTAQNSIQISAQCVKFRPTKFSYR